MVVGKQIFVRDALNLSWAGVLLPHDQLIAACCMSPDGGLILSACDDGIARVWERATGKLLAATPKVSQSIVSVAFSPNATRFVTATEDGTVRIWWTANARPATGTFSHGSTVTGLAFSPDGRYLISTSGDSTWFNLRGGEPFFRVWDASNGDSICCRMVKRLSGRFPMSDRGSDPWRLAVRFFSADGKTLSLVTTGGILTSLDLRADSRSSEDFVREVGLRSGMQVDSAGGVLLLEADQLRSMWQSEARQP